MFDLDAGLERRVDLTGGSAATSTTGQIANGGGAKMDRGPTRRLVHLVLTSVRCQDSAAGRDAANKNTPQLERKIRLHSPPPVRAKHLGGLLQ